MRALRERIYLANLIPFRLSEKREKKIYIPKKKKKLSPLSPNTGYNYAYRAQRCLFRRSIKRNRGQGKKKKKKKKWEKKH